MTAHDSAHDSARRPGIRLASIWAQDRRRVIGSGTGMLWRVPADLAFFKRTTDGAPIVMGRASWEALGGALPGRDNIVITGRAGYEAPGATVVTSLDGALAQARESAARLGADTVWITGGARVYAETIDLVDRLVISQLDLEIGADAGPVVYAPRVDPDRWRLSEALSDPDWRPRSGDARWRVCVFDRIEEPPATRE